MEGTSGHLAAAGYNLRWFAATYAGLHCLGKVFGYFRPSPVLLNCITLESNQTFPGTHFSRQ